MLGERKIENEKVKIHRTVLTVINKAQTFHSVEFKRSEYVNCLCNNIDVLMLFAFPILICQTAISAKYSNIPSIAAPYEEVQLQTRNLHENYVEYVHPNP